MRPSMQDTRSYRGPDGERRREARAIGRVCYACLREIPEAGALVFTADGYSLHLGCLNGGHHA